MPNSLSAKPYQVLVHTEEVLVLQTNAGARLVSDKQLSSDNNQEQQADSFGRFNLGLHVHDDPVKVLANRGRLLALVNQYLANENSLSSVVEAIYWLNQIHSNQVIRIGESDKSGSYPLSLTPPSADALVTSKSNQALSIMTADCVPIVIYDPNTKQIAAIHAGWKGLANGVIFETFKAFAKVDQPADSQLEAKANANLDCVTDADTVEAEAKPIQAWIGACISQSCYEVSLEVIDKLLTGCEKGGMDINAIRAEVVAKHKDPNKAWLDLPKLAQLQLNQLGAKVEIPAELGQASPALACSYADSHYYSYRRKTHLGQRHTGRMALLIVRLN